MHPLVNAVGVPVISADRRRVMSLNLGGVSLACTPELLGGEVSVALTSGRKLPQQERQYRPGELLWPDLQRQPVHLDHACRDGT